MRGDQFDRMCLTLSQELELPYSVYDHLIGERVKFKILSSNFTEELVLAHSLAWIV